MRWPGTMQRRLVQVRVLPWSARPLVAVEPLAVLVRMGEQWSAPERAARRIRSEATGRVNRHIMHGHFWSPSYLAASCGGAPPGSIRQYTEQQRRPVNATSGLTPP